METEQIRELIAYRTGFNEYPPKAKPGWMDEGVDYTSSLLYELIDRRIAAKAVPASAAAQDATYPYEEWTDRNWPSSTYVHRTAIVYPGVILGEDCWIGPYTVIGSPGEKRAPIGEGEGQVRIGDRTIIREFTAVQGPAVIGSDCHIMDKSHVAHDCILGDFVTLSPGVTLGGFSQVADKATLGIGTSVHQHRRIGVGAMVGMNSTVTSDVPAWEKWFGSPAKCRGYNTVGMGRWGVPVPDREIPYEWMTDAELFNHLSESRSS